ncbi:hypothetical protein HNO51_08330 [Billgrantia sulfidoxydans]|uniref:Uncharacterized protein n=1 Tax=Billgrantia sulfidoxydans TaxID=2733484 RepID=A0ABX7W6P7_9GAMM|nr:type I-F CRISPR-associated protein Csy2 [Halomonas sulfidoxydans]QTP54688.1 hypothetical protein HNO51_08330 [Halomonas sulfidoxydans]
MHIEEIVYNNNVQERSALIRRHFSPFTPLLDVTGSESVAVIALANLSQRKEVGEDLLDETTARKILKNTSFLESCLKEVSWQHTHNLKFPDPRVSGQRIISNPPCMISGYLSSSGLAKELGWAHNSAAYNKSKLFGACFLWQGGAVNLSVVLKEASHVWVSSLLALEVSPSALQEWKIKLSRYGGTHRIPKVVSRYSPQVRFLYKSNYVSITPVVSHSFMSEIERLARKKIGRFLNIKYPRSASLGDLSGSTGGNLNILDYPPYLVKNESASLSGSGIRRLEDGESLFAKSAIFDKDFLSACRAIIKSEEIPTYKIKKTERRHAVAAIKSHLADWLAPVFEWKESVGDIKQVPCYLNDTLEWRFSSNSFISKDEAAREAASALNKQMCDNSKTRGLAYHPSLLKPLENILRGLIDKQGAARLSTCKVNSGMDGGGKFIYLKKLEVYDASAMPIPYLYGIPSLTALWGMAKEYEIKLNKMHGAELSFNSVAWFLRSYQGGSETKLPAKTRVVGKKVMPPGLKPSRYCDMTMDILVRVHDPENALESMDSELMHAAFPSRFAGGVLLPPAQDTEMEWCRVGSGDSLFQELKRLPRSGRWIVPELIGCDGLEQALVFFGKFKSMKPVMAGYSLLEEPAQREGALEPLHAYAESLLGAARLASPVEFRLRGWQALTEEAFWGMRIENSAMLMGRV